MSWRSFGGSLLFAGAAGLASYPLALLLTPFFGWWGAPALVFTVWIVLYTAGLVRGPGHRALAAVALLSLALVLNAVDASFQSVAVALGAALGVTRSGFVFRTRPLRGFAIELAIGAAALGMLVFFGGSGPGATALGVWGYFLIQSGYFLVGGRRARDAADAALDPFEEARRQAERILEGV